MHENNKKCDANEAKPKKRAKEIKITAGRGCSSNQGVQEQNKSGIGPRKGKRHAVGPKGVQTGSKAEPVRPIGINIGDIDFFLIFHPSFSLYTYF